MRESNSFVFCLTQKVYYADSALFRSEVVQCKLTGPPQLILDFHRSHLHRAYLTEKVSPLRPSWRANRQESKSNKNVSFGVAR